MTIEEPPDWVQFEPVRKPRIYLVPFDQIKLGTERRYLVKGLIPRVGLTIVWGPPKSGKSFWVFDLVMHVALCREYRGRRVHGGPVVYCAFEGQSGLEARAEAFRQRSLAEDHGPIPFYLQPVTLDLIKDHEELISVIRAQLGDAPVVVVLDTLNRSLAGSESSDVDMSDYIKAADAIREAFNCAVIVVHHCGLEGTRPRGHTSLTGAADAQISVRRDASDRIVITLELAKDGPQGETVASRLEVVEVGADDDGDIITSCVIVPAEDGASMAAARVTGAAKTALELLRRSIDDDGKPAPHSHHFPAGARTVPVSLWRTYCETGTVAESDKPDSRRKAFARACEKLQALGLVGLWANLVWIIEPTRTTRT